MNLPYEEADRTAMRRALAKFFRSEQGGENPPVKAMWLAGNALYEGILRWKSPEGELATWDPHSPLRRLYDHYRNPLTPYP